MNEQEGLAPAIHSILDAARSRDRATTDGRVDGSGRVDVDARSFPHAVADAEAAGRVPVIAEVKPTSPTTEGERTDDPVELAEQMVAGGATAISVLTEPEHFGGSPENLTAIREAVEVPVLRKDFILREDQLDVVESDLVLLIARFVGDDLPHLVEAARDRGFQPLVEVHTTDELHAALDAGADVIGVNNRDLAKLEVDLSTFETVAEAVPEDVRDGLVLVAESGISTPGDVRRMRNAGADALLVGSAIMQGDVESNTRTLVSATTGGDQ